jgi:hypothetical protein
VSRHFNKNEFLQYKTPKNAIIDKTLTYASETWILTKIVRKPIKIFERKVYSRILGPVYDNKRKIRKY